MKKTIYVSPRGDDSNCGSKSAPLASVAAAVSHSGCGKIILDEGEYHISTTIKLGPENSGLTIQAAKDCEVVISGGRVVDGWKEETNGLWSAPVPWVTSRVAGFRQLVVNGSSRQRSCLPKSGFFTAAPFPKPPEADWYTFCHSTERFRFEIQDGDVKPEWNLENGELIMYHYWVDSHVVPTSVVKEDGKTWVELKYPLKRSPDNALYRIENLREIISEPGEWALDYAEKKVYYKPAQGENMRMAHVVAPFVENLLEISGARDISFSGIKFADSRFELAAGDRNDGQASSTVSAAVKIDHSENCQFDHCGFIRLSGYAVDLMSGTRNCRISHSSILGLGAGGVRLHTPQCVCSRWEPGQSWDYQMPDPKERVVGNEIVDCEIADYGRDFKSAVGVLVMAAEGTKVCHNNIHDGYYTGVSVGWNWGYHPSLARDNEIDFNHIYNIGKGILSDMGGIYTLGVSPGTKLRNNIIHDIDAKNYGGWGLYNDEGSTGILLENNIVYNTKFSCYHMHFGRNCTIRNNIFAGGRIDQLARSRREPHTSFFFYNNIVFWTEGLLHTGNWEDSEEYKFTYFPLRERILRKTTECDYNLYFNPNKKLDEVEWGSQHCTFKEWQEKFLQDAHSEWGDPLFADAEKHDYAIAPDSPALKLGFRPIDISEVGPRL